MKTRNLLFWALLICLCFTATACNNPAQNIPTTNLDENDNANGSIATSAAASVATSAAASVATSAAASVATSEEAGVTTADGLEVAPLDTLLYTVGDIPVTFGEFLFQYRVLIHAYRDTGQYMNSGMDPSLPLDEQYYDEDAGVTWQEMFSGAVNEALCRNLAMYQEAQAVGYQMGDWEKEHVESFLDSISASSQEQGVTADVFVGQQYGEGLTLAMVTGFQQRYWMGVGYETSCRDSKTFTDDEIADYYEQRKDEVDLPDCTLVTLRNIFMYDKDDARVMLDEFDKGDKSEKTFIEFVGKYSDDGDSRENGGLIENYRPANPESSFTDIEAWLFDSERKQGDFMIYEWDNGIELLFFVSKGESFRTVWSRESLMEEYIGEMIDKYPIEYPEG